jgi:hypothetical protein
MRARLVYVCCALATAWLRAAEPEGAVVQLPPMVVMETAKGPPWYYLNTPGGEYLARTTPATLREFAQADMRLFQLLKGLVPESFQARSDLRSLVVLDRLDQKAEGDAIMQDMARQAEQRATAQREADPLAPRPSSSRVETLLNLRVDDRDMNVLFGYIDEKNFEGSRMVLTANYVRFLMERRAPDLPSWLIEGVVSIFEQSSFVVDPITVRPFTWISWRETRALQRDPDWPRALLPMGELLAPDSLRAEADHAPPRVTAWRYQVALFFRWGNDPKNGVREAFWKLAERATKDVITDKIFEEYFGFGMSEMRDRLSDYLPTAVREPMHIEPGKVERVRLDDPKPASKELVARLLGEWQRLEIYYVAARHPRFREAFAQEARRTLRKGYDLGDRDPQLLAALGLCEIDAGNPDGAPFFLKLAIEAKVVRPRAYFEVARMRFLDLLRNQPATYLLSAAETESVVAPLREGLRQKPLMAEAVALFATTWLRSAQAPTEVDFALLRHAAETFPARPTTLFRIAAVCANSGRFAAAEALLDQAMRFPVDDQMRTPMAELKKVIARARK